MKRTILYLTVLVLLFLTGVTFAQTGKQGALAKFDDALVTLHERYSTHLAARATAQFSSDNPLVRLVADRVIVDAVAAGDSETLKSELELLGMQEAVVFGRVVSGQLPITAIPEAAALANLRFARSAAFMTLAGAVTSQGDAAQRSNIGRSQFAVDGTGVTVGVISDSYDSLGGAAADVASGDLPPAVQVIQDSGTTDEGRAMLQIVHDVAPGASLAFATASGGQANFANNIIALKNAGSKVIVDDIIYFTEPMFQDGIIAQAVDNVVAEGVAYFSSAGNSARSAYQSAFRNSGINLGSNGTNQIPTISTFIAHDFDPGPGVDLFQTVTLPPGATCFSFQWADRYFSVSGNPGAQTDLDVAVFVNGTFFDGRFDSNVGNDPIEMDCINNPNSVPLQVQFAAGKFAGPDPSLIKYVAFRSTFVVNQFATNSGTIFGHANAVGAQAVGAAAYNNTPAFGVSPPILETFSSGGTTPILFDLAGNPTNDPRADKPEIVAPDGADTTFFGGFDPDTTGFPNFFGTSAAAPHAAGVAALLLEANPAITPAQIYNALQSTAINMGVAGFDNDSGFGLIQADAALALVISSLPDTTAPGDVASLKAGPVTQIGVILNWIAPGDDGDTGTAATYDVRYSNQPLNSSNFGGATPASNEPAPGPAGTAQVFDAQGLQCAQTYYFALTTADEVNNTSAISNVATAKTAACNKLTVSPRRLPVAEQNVLYNSGPINITNGAPPYSLQVLTNTSADISYDPASGSFKGTPSGPGIFRITGIASDAVGSQKKASFSGKINNPVQITTKALRDGKVSVPYRTTFKAKYGVKPYEWEVIPGGLLLGDFQFDKTTGKATLLAINPGTVDLNIKVKSLTGGTANQNLTLEFK